MSQPPLFDSHLHLTSERFEEDRSKVLARASEAGVAEMVTIASNPSDAAAAIALASELPGVWATAGLHPHEAESTSEALISEIAQLAASPHVVAIGETGLDFFYDNAPRETQIRNFRAHLDVAERLELPIVVHSREADTETAALIREYRGRVVGVLHCFAGSMDLLSAGLEADWYVSFSGLVTFVPDLEAPARRVPADRLLIETDAPYLAPAPKRGRRNEPGFLTYTCDALATIRDDPSEAVAVSTGRNARRFYGLVGAVS